MKAFCSVRVPAGVMGGVQVATRAGRLLAEVLAAARREVDAQLLWLAVRPGEDRMRQ
jgi:hypothetical protein